MAVSRLVQRSNLRRLFAADGTIYVRASWGRETCTPLNPDGTLKMAVMQPKDKVVSSPAIGADGTVYVGSDDGFLYAIKPDGSLLWKYEVIDTVRSSPAIGADGTIYVAGYDGNLHAIKPDGNARWRKDIGSIYFFSSPAVGADGVIYIGSDKGEVYALAPDGTVQWQRPTGGAVFTSPMIAKNGTIYVGSNDGFFYALSSTSQGAANSPWPMFRHDICHTGRVGGTCP
jgi:sugar lactone lactonase YvrE